jgi:hypothetical protein
MVVATAAAQPEPTRPRRHLLAVWNPVLASDAMEQHIRVLQDAAQKFRHGKLREDEVYVWWGKLRSEHRTKPLPHLDEILALDVEPSRDAPGEETHIYLTDFASLYVAHLGEVRREPPEGREDGRVPSFYRKLARDRGLKGSAGLADCWFKLWDIRRLVADDTTEVAYELRKLRNTRYGDRDVSLYGGMVELPLIVTSARSERYFDSAVRQSWTDGRFWVEFDAEQSGTGAIERDLRENLFGEDAWRALGPTVRTFIASGERMFREHLRDQMFDLGLALLEFGKALEVRCNNLLREALEGAPGAVRYLNMDGESRDVTKGHLGLKEIARYLSERETAAYLCRRIKDGAQFLTVELPRILDDFANVRNQVAHKELVERDEVVRWRSWLCGVGRDGVLVRLAEVDLHMKET